MQIKKTIVAVSLAVAATTACAENFQAEVSASYLDFDVADGFGISGQVHFNEVSVSGHPLAEAGYLEQSSNVALTYIDIEDEDITDVSAEFYLDGLYIAPGYTDSSVGDGEFYAAVGYASKDGWRVTTTVPEEDYEFNVYFKYVTAISDSNFINIEASYADGGDFFEDETSIAADYYLDKTFSVGAIIVDAADTDFGVRVNKFFTGKIRAGAMYMSGDLFDTFIVDVSARF